MQRLAGYSATGLHFPSFSEGLSLRPRDELFGAGCRRTFPFLFGGTFIEAYGIGVAVSRAGSPNFPSFSEGLSLRHPKIQFVTVLAADFPSFSEGLSLRPELGIDWSRSQARDFPSFSEGLSLRRLRGGKPRNLTGEHFPSFSEGLSLRLASSMLDFSSRPKFPFLFGGTFIEAPTYLLKPFSSTRISLPFRRDFH